MQRIRQDVYRDTKRPLGPIGRRIIRVLRRTSPLFTHDLAHRLYCSELKNDRQNKVRSVCKACHCLENRGLIKGRVTFGDVSRKWEIEWEFITAPVRTKTGGRAPRGKPFSGLRDFSYAILDRLSHSPTHTIELAEYFFLEKKDFFRRKRYYVMRVATALSRLESRGAVKRVQIKRSRGGRGNPPHLWYLVYWLPIWEGRKKAQAHYRRKFSRPWSQRLGVVWDY